MNHTLLELPKLGRKTSIDLLSEFICLSLGLVVLHTLGIFFKFSSVLLPKADSLPVAIASSNAEDCMGGTGGGEEGIKLELGRAVEMCGVCLIYINCSW